MSLKTATAIAFFCMILRLGFGIYNVASAAKRMSMDLGEVPAWMWVNWITVILSDLGLSLFLGVLLFKQINRRSANV